MELEKLDRHMRKNETGPLSYPYTKINSKRTTDLNMRPEAIKLLEENVGGQLPDICVGDDFLNLINKSKSNKNE